MDLNVFAPKDFLEPRIFNQNILELKIIWHKMDQTKSFLNPKLCGPTFFGDSYVRTKNLYRPKINFSILLTRNFILDQLPNVATLHKSYLILT